VVVVDFLVSKDGTSVQRFDGKNAMQLLPEVEKLL
jgi:hypothetical protein